MRKKKLMINVKRGNSLVSSSYIAARLKQTLQGLVIVLQIMMPCVVICDANHL